MENREKILKLLMNEVLSKIFNPKEKLTDFFEYDLKKYPKYFKKDEVETCAEKLEILKYSIANSEDWLNDNLEIIEYFMLDLQKFLLSLEKKKKEFISEMIKECINSIKNYKEFYKFVSNSEFYFNNNKNYFNEFEIERYNELWMELEIENAIILSEEKNNKENEWKKRYDFIIEKIRKMLLFLNEIS